MNEFDACGLTKVERDQASVPDHVFIENPYGLADGIFDEETGLTCFRVRCLDPRTGRWLSEDPLGFTGGDLNLYSYVGKRPVSHIDPFGLWSFAAEYVYRYALSSPLSIVDPDGLIEVRST